MFLMKILYIHDVIIINILHIGRKIFFILKYVLLTLNNVLPHSINFIKQTFILKFFIFMLMGILT